MTTELPGGAEHEAELRAYLLGTLDPERRDEIEGRFLADEALHEELQATADDLIHAYLAGQLSAAEREHFETHFLASPRRRERVAFVRSLVAAAKRVQTAPRFTGGPWRTSSLLPWAAVLLVTLGTGLWTIGERRQAGRRLAAASQREEALRQKLLALEERARAQTGAADVATWDLGASTDRGTVRPDAFRVGAEWIRLRVTLEHDLRVPSYRASLRTSDGRELLRLGGLREASRPAGRTLDVMVPAGLLHPGAYLLSIQRDAPGPPEELTAATFLIR